MNDGSIGQTTRPATKPSELNQERRISGKTIYKLIESQGFKCALTGWDLEPATASIDHIKPLSNGGSHTIDNAQIVHSLVNTAKGTLSNEEFIKVCQAVASHHNSQSL